MTTGAADYPLAFECQRNVTRIFWVSLILFLSLEAMSGKEIDPRPLSATPLQGASRKIATSGSLLVSMGSERVDVFDKNDPAGLQLKATIFLTNESPNTIAIQGSLLYVLTYDAHLHIYDLSTPAVPRQRSDLHLKTYGGGGMAVAGRSIQEMQFCRAQRHFFLPIGRIG